MSGCEKIASRSQLLQLGSMLLQRIPNDLSAEVAQEWIDAPDTIAAVLHSLRYGFLRRHQQHTFTVQIDPTRTVEQWRDAGHYYGSALSDFGDHTSAHFNQFLTTKGNEVVQAEVVAFCLGWRVTTDIAKRMRQRLGLHPIGIEHELAICEQYPDEPRVYQRMVNLDSVLITPDGKRYLSCLCHFGFPEFARYLSLESVDSTWDEGEGVWFLGLRK